MKFKGIYWIGIQDIGGFTSLSEQLAKQGKKGTEKLCTIITKFFNQAEKKILEHNGRIFKFAGDAYYAIFPANIEAQKMKSLGISLLNLHILKQTGLKTRFIAVRGEVEGEWIKIPDDTHDLLINGSVIYDLHLLEENTPAGKMSVLSGGYNSLNQSLPEFPAPHKGIQYQPAHRPLYIAFVEIPQDSSLVHKINEFFCNQKESIRLLKWIPSQNTFKALLIAGFLKSTGKEGEVMIDAFNRLKADFKKGQLKMGLSSGVVFAGEIKTKKFREFAVLGDRVNTAARLCAIAPDNGIYISGEIKEFLKAKFNFIDAGAITLKGKEEKIRIYVPQEKISRILTRELFSFKFIGREKELADAIQLVNKRKSICFIGDAGTGKSRMLYELKNKISDKNIIEVALSPLSPPLFLLKQIVQHLPVGQFPELKKYLDGFLQLPQVRVVELLKKLLRTGGRLTIFIDDLQWLDDASFILLKELVPLPFLILASSRPEGIKFIDELMIQKFFLKNLSARSLKILFKEMLGMAPDKKLLGFLWSRTQGNPFYFEQILKEMGEKGFLIENKQCFSFDAGTKTLPFSIHSILLSRFDNLPDVVKEAVEIAACIGREFSLETIRKVASNPRVNLEPACQNGIVLMTDGIYQFKHALFQDAIMDSLLDTRRKMYERRIGMVFIKEKRDPYEIAHHLTAGGEPYRALPYWYDTFAQFYSRGFHREISSIIQRLTGDDNEGVKAIGNFLNALYLTKMSDYYDAERILLALKKKQRLRKKVLFGLAELYDWSSQYSKMKGALDELKDYSMDINEKVNYLELCGIYYDMVGNNKKGLGYYYKTLRISKKYKMKGAIAASLFNIGWIFFKTQQYQKAKGFFQRALGLNDKGDIFFEGCCLLRLGQIAMLEQNYEMAQNYLRKSLRNFQMLDFTYWIWITLSALTNLYVMMNNRRKALLLAHKTDSIAAIVSGRVNHVYMYHLYYGNLARFSKLIKGREDKYPLEYLIFLLARNKKNEARDFVNRHNLKNIIPQKGLLKQKTFPLTFTMLYRKYLKCDEVDLY